MSLISSSLQVGFSEQGCLSWEFTVFLHEFKRQVAEPSGLRHTYRYYLFDSTPGYYLLLTARDTR